MTRMTGPDGAVMCSSINTHTHTHTHINTHTHTHTRHRMTRMTGPDCVVMCNLINTHTHTQHTHTWLVGDFSCDCMFWENNGGGLTTQPVGTATMTTVTSANRVDLESFSSRCWTFRRTHTSADPIRVLCTRLALPLTLSLTSRLAPRARLTVDVPTRAFWLAGIFLRR